MAGRETRSFGDADVKLRRSQADLARQLFRLCRPELRRIVGVFVLQSTQLVASVFALSYLGAGIDYLRAWIADSPTPVQWPFGLAPPDHWPIWAVPLFAAAMMGLIAAGRTVLSAQATISLGVLLHERVIPRLQRRVFIRLQQLSFRFFDRQHSGAIINRVTGDVQAVRLFVENGVLETMTLGLTSIIFAVYMLQVAPVLALACMAPLPLMMWISVRFSRAVRPRYLDSRARFDRMILNLSENTQGAYLVKSFALEDESRRRFGGLNAEVQDSQRRIFRRVSLFSALLNLLNHASLVILLAFGGWMVIRGQLALGTGFVVFASLLQQLSNQIGTLSQVVTSVQESLSGAERVFQILDAPSDVESPARPLKSGRMQGDVSFEGVSFGFDTQRPALQGLDFRVAPGQLIAVVGETGAGKSALLGLIPRHYDPERGAVRIDGVDLRQWHLSDLRRQVGVVFQEPFIFSASIAENIRFGRAEACDAQVRHAAQMARAHDFILETEHGYDTVLEESGSNLSGGQRQRIALARALIADPAILLLDDPTSALDPETEHEIFAAMDQAMASRTTFVVAHRLSTLQRADRVLLLFGGRLADSGTHAELMCRNTQYRAAAEMQLDASQTDGISMSEPGSESETEPDTELQGEAA